MPPHAPRAVLYVEDDRINTILMEEVFRLLPDWQLECAEDATQALVLLQTLRPALVLIDMNLPDMNGIELLHRMRADPCLATLPCVMLSADDQPSDVAAALAAGFAEYWVKPIQVPRLAATLQATLLAGDAA